MERNELWAEIKKIAEKYDRDLDIKERVKLLEFIKTDIKIEKEELETKLKSFSDALEEKTGRRGRPPKTQSDVGASAFKGRGRRKGKVSVSDGIITALADGPLDYDELKSKVDKICGRDVGKIY